MNTESNKSDQHSTSGFGHPTPQRCVAKHANTYIHERGLSVSDFALDVAEAYAARTAPEERIYGVVFDGDPNDSYAFARWQSRHIKRTSRQLSCENLAQFDLIWNGFLPALPEQYRSAAIRDLCADHGMMPIPDVSAEAEAADSSNLVLADGNEIQSLTRITADGKVDENDFHLMPEAIDNFRAAAMSSLGWARFLESEYERIKAEGVQNKTLRSVS